MQAYNYDSLNRLKDATEMLTPNGGSATQTWTQTFLYDRYGNRNFDEANTAFTGFLKECGGSMCAALKKVMNPSINTANNRLTTSDDYSFDNAGNTIEDAQGRVFVYDAENKQVEVRNASSQTIGQYWYDGDGRRVKKYVPAVGENPAEITVFVYDAGGKLVAEYSTIVASANEAKVAYLTNDHLGSPRINTDRDGNVTARHDYHPFGEEITTSQRIAGLNHADDTVRKQFTGYERDIEIDLDFAQARMYNPAHGRFTTVDPLNESAKAEDPMTWNRFVYALDNPVRFSDPTGMIAGDFYDREGNWLGTDEKGDGMIYLLGPHKAPNKEENKHVNWGGKLSDADAKWLKDNSIEVKGLIIMERFLETKDSTTSGFKTVGGQGKDVEGMVLEPAGPDTIKPR